jgi:hypothetical protein
MADLTIAAEEFGNLDADQTQKLQQIWNRLLELFAVAGHSNTRRPDTMTESRSRSLGNLSCMTPDVFRREFWNFILSEHPDAMVLRFLRARKWDVEAALAMLVSAVQWRHERRLDKTVIFTGESVGLKDTQSNDDKGFISQYRSGKSYVRATDREDRPIYIIRVKLHDPSLQSSHAMETYILHNIESIRLLVCPPCDKCCLIFDMTGFGLKNMDFHVVKFLVSVFEARYPETLGVVLIHNAPFVFWGK